MEFHFGTSFAHCTSGDLFQCTRRSRSNHFQERTSTSGDRTHSRDGAVSFKNLEIRPRVDQYLVQLGDNNAFPSPTTLSPPNLPLKSLRKVENVSTSVQRRSFFYTSQPVKIDSGTWVCVAVHGAIFGLVRFSCSTVGRPFCQLYIRWPRHVQTEYMSLQYMNFFVLL